MKFFCKCFLIFFCLPAFVKAQNPGNRPKPIIQDAAKPTIIGTDVRIIDNKEPARAGSKPLIKYTIQKKPPRISPDPNHPGTGSVKDITPPQPYFTTIELDAGHPKADYASLAFYSAIVVSAVDGMADFTVSEPSQSSPLLGGFGGFEKKTKSICLQCPGFLLHFKTKPNLQYEIMVNVKSETDRLFYLFPDFSQTNYQSFAVSAGDQTFLFIIQADDDGYANLFLNSSAIGKWSFKKVVLKKL